LKVDRQWQNRIDDFYRKLNKRSQQNFAVREEARKQREAASDRNFWI